jgi:mannosyltransferase OCH1-like enzyme
MLNPQVDLVFHEKYKQAMPFLETFRKLYDHNDIDNLRPLEEPTPLIFHFIWLGSPLPAIYEENIESFRIHNPDCIIILWDDSLLDAEEFENKDLFKQATNPAEKSDIARIYLLDKYGGVYVDVDVKCLKSFKLLNTYYDFYAGLAPITNNIGFINNGVIGAKAGHPILKKYMELMRKYKNERGIVYRTGPAVFTEAFKQTLKENPYAFMHSIILPASFFSPLGGDNSFTTQEEHEKEIGPEAFAVHYYHASWTKKSKFSQRNHQ